MKITNIEPQTIPVDTYDFNDYEDKIKDYCVICMMAIDATWASYLLRGNYCSTCNERCSRMSRTTEAKEFRKKIEKEFKNQIKRLDES